MDDTGNVTQDGQADVDQQVHTASSLQENTQGRKNDGEDDLANISEKRIVSTVTRNGRSAREVPRRCRVLTRR